jgi:hypothetical protein
MSIRAIFGDRSPVERLAAYADLDEYALLHQAARWARGEDVGEPGSPSETGRPSESGRPSEPRVARIPRLPREMADAWRAILLRRPNWRSETEIRAEYEAGAEPTTLIAGLGEAIPGQVAIDLAVVDARPADVAPGATPRLALEMRDGSGEPSLAQALARLPGYALIGRRYRRVQ